MKNNCSFVTFEKKTGLVYDDSQSEFPTKLHTIYGNVSYQLNEGSTYFIYVHYGIAYYNGDTPIKPKMYCSATSGYISTSEDAILIIIERIGYKGMFVLGGPIEKEGRLKYIDGCTDSLLIPPVKYGDACFNHLHFPEKIYQTMHTHPSIRVGMVTKGNGLCLTPFGNIELKEGIVFCILPSNGKYEIGLDDKTYQHGSHCFQTFDETMDVIAFHPDSDFGPKDEEHPMINRTIVDGISAKDIETIRTK